MQKEIMIVARVRAVSESEILKMEMMQYYQTLAVLESYNKDIEEKVKEGKG